MAKKTITAVDVKNKRVLTRVDFNVPIEDGKITDDRRIRMAIPTIKSIIDRGGSAVLVSHLGRPEGKGYEAGESLEPTAGHLQELLGKPVQFPSHDCTDEKAAAAVKAMKPGDVVLLDNLRFHAGEKKGDPTFAAKLAAYGDIYCNDAFGTAHREDASMYAVPMAMMSKARVAGLLLDKELKYLADTLAKPAHPFVVVLGGAKVSDKLPVISNLLTKADEILVGGAMAYTFLKALGRKVGASKTEDNMLKQAKEIIDAAAKSKCQLHLPSDHVCSTMFAEKGGKVEVFADAIGDGFIGLDIGPKTQTTYAMKLNKAKTIVWNGPMGVFEWQNFRVGTKMIADAIADATGKGATTIVGGGDSAAAAEMLGVAEKVSHVSTGGGASLEMLGGAKFKSVDVLDNA